jgi:hypothetical protein
MVGDRMSHVLTDVSYKTHGARSRFIGQYPAEQALNRVSAYGFVQFLGDVRRRCIGSGFWWVPCARLIEKPQST